MKTFVLVAALVLLVQGRPESGYNYLKSAPKKPIPSGSSDVATSSGGEIGRGIGDIKRHFYVHVPAPESVKLRSKKPILVPTAEKYYKLLFIKSPTPPTTIVPVIPVKPQNEDKTLVYVLPKIPEIIIPTAAPKQPAKPKVHFIRYNSQKGGDSAAIDRVGEVTGAEIGGRLGTIVVGEIGEEIDSDGCEENETPVHLRPSVSYGVRGTAGVRGFGGNHGRSIGKENVSGHSSDIGGRINGELSGGISNGIKGSFGGSKIQASKLISSGSYGVPRNGGASKRGYGDRGSSLGGRGDGHGSGIGQRGGSRLNGGIADEISGATGRIVGGRLDGSLGTGSRDGIGNDAGRFSVIKKHIYVYAAPPEPVKYRPQKPIKVPEPQTHYKIIFIKAPTSPTPTVPQIPVLSTSEEKTLIYVLTKKPEHAPEIVIPTAVPTQPAKPEVYFIRYNTQKEGDGTSDGDIGAGKSDAIHEKHKGNGSSSGNTGLSAPSRGSRGYRSPSRSKPYKKRTL